MNANVPLKFICWNIIVYVILLREDSSGQLAELQQLGEKLPLTKLRKP